MRKARDGQDQSVGKAVQIELMDAKGPENKAVANCRLQVAGCRLPSLWVNRPFAEVSKLQHLAWKIGRELEKPIERRVPGKVDFECGLEMFASSVGVEFDF